MAIGISSSLIRERRKRGEQKRDPTMCIRVLAGLFVIWIAVIPTRARADAEVTAARGVHLKIGARVLSKDVLEIPERAELRLLWQSNGAVYVINGPFRGTLQEFIDRCKGWWRRWLFDVCKPPGDGDRLPIGGTRGGYQPEPTGK
jgi:hypothetical protein